MVLLAKQNGNYSIYWGPESDFQQHNFESLMKKINRFNTFERCQDILKF